MKLLKNSQSGQTMIMALILLALGSLLVVPLLNHSFTNLGLHQSIECRTLNSYSADSGVQYVLAKLYNEPGAYTDNPLQEGFILNGRTVNVTANYTGAGIYKVTSTAGGGGCGSTRIASYVNLSAGAFSFSLAAKDYMIIERALVDSAPDPGNGDLHSNGNIELIGGNVWVNGDASAVGTITGDEITGTRTEDVSEVQFPGDYSGLYKAMAQEGDIYNDDHTLQSATPVSFGPAFIDGNLFVRPGTTVILEGTVYVTGYILVENGRLEGEENIAAEGDITIHGGGTGSVEVIPIYTSVYGDIALEGPVVDAVLYAPNGSVTLSSVHLYGALGAVTVDINNVIITYASQLAGREDLPGSELHTIAYSYE